MFTCLEESHSVALGMRTTIVRAILSWIPWFRAVFIRKKALKNQPTKKIEVIKTNVMYLYIADGKVMSFPSV